MSESSSHPIPVSAAAEPAGEPVDSSRPVVVAEQVERLRAELSELACELDRRGRPDAADLAASLVIRLGDILGYGARDPEAAGAAGA